LLLTNDGLTVPTYTVTLEPDNSGFPIEGPINMYFSVTLTDWSLIVANTDSTFTYEITDCVILTINPHDHTNEAYVVHDTSTDFTITPWTQTPTCAYTITYTAFLIDVGGNEISLAAPITFDGATPKVIISSTTCSDVDIYTVRIYGTNIHNTNTVTNSDDFDIVVTMDCRCNEITVNTAAPDITFTMKFVNV
jgi:hypothetical protein